MAKIIKYTITAYCDVSGNTITVIFYEDDSEFYPKTHKEPICAHLLGRTCTLSHKYCGFTD